MLRAELLIPLLKSVTDDPISLLQLQTALAFLLSRATAFLTAGLGRSYVAKPARVAEGLRQLATAYSEKLEQRKSADLPVMPHSLLVVFVSYLYAFVEVSVNLEKP